MKTDVGGRILESAVSKVVAPSWVTRSGPPPPLSGPNGANIAGHCAVIGVAPPGGDWRRLIGRDAVAPEGLTHPPGAGRGKHSQIQRAVHFKGSRTHHHQGALRGRGDTATVSNEAARSPGHPAPPRGPGPSEPGNHCQISLSNEPARGHGTAAYPGRTAPHRPAPPPTLPPTRRTWRAV